QAHLIRRGRRQAELPRALVHAHRRAQRGHLDVQLPDQRLAARPLGAQRVQPIGEVHLLYAQPDEEQRDDDEDGRQRERGGERAPHARIRFAVKSLGLDHGVRSSTRSLALRARGLARTSSSPGVRGDGSSSAKFAAASARNACFTMRSSPEWNEITPSRPPAASRWGISWSVWRSAPVSSFTAMRSAWNVRVATCVRFGHAARGTAARTAATRSPVVRRGRRLTMTRAMRRANRSPPCSYRRRASSASSAWFTRSAAVSPRDGSRRMSRGSFCWKLKPRPDSSSWSLDTPRSWSTARASRLPY